MASMKDSAWRLAATEFDRDKLVRELGDFLEEVVNHNGAPDV